MFFFRFFIYLCFFFLKKAQGGKCLISSFFLFFLGEESVREEGKKCVREGRGSDGGFCLLKCRIFIFLYFFPFFLLRIKIEKHKKVNQTRISSRPSRFRIFLPLKNFFHFFFEKIKIRTQANKK